MSKTDFEEWRDSLPATHWARHDISACKLGWDAAIEAYLRAASRDAEPVAWRYRVFQGRYNGVDVYSSWLYSDTTPIAGTVHTEPLFTFQPDALVHVDGVTMTPTAAANRIAELSAAQADHSTAIEPVAASPGVGDGWRYSINYGPDGEEDWANLIAPDGQHVANIRTHHAMAIVTGLRRRSGKSWRLSVRPNTE